MSLIDTIQAMKAAGVDAETILEVVERVEGERLAKQRARKAKSRNTAPCHVTSVTERDSRDQKAENAKSLKNNNNGNVTDVTSQPQQQKEKENSPHTPQKKNKNNIYNPPKSPHRSVASRYGDESDPLFSKFLTDVWRYRWRDGDNRKTAFKAFARLSPSEQKLCIDAMQQAAAWAGKRQNEFRPMMASWINRNGWEEFQTQKSNAPADEADWQKRVDYFNQTDEWAAGWGPKPYTAGCRVPAHLLEEDAA